MSLTVGDPAPWFHAATPSNPDYAFDTVAGRYVLLAFLPSDMAARARAMVAVAGHRASFDDVRACAFMVARDAPTAGAANDLRGLRWFLDLDGAVSRLYGALDAQGEERPMWVLLDPTLRVLACAPIAEAQAVFALLLRLPPPAGHAGTPLHAPVLVLPRVFEPELCAELIALHDGGDAKFTGVMRDEGGRTVAVMDDLKKRRDVLVADADLQGTLRERLQRRLFPEIEKVTAFQVTQIERYVVSRYDADEGGVFHPHRDDVTLGTAHRRFACSINLNDDFAGGDLRFPEFGPRTYRPPPGGAVVFSCSLLHEVTPMTAGRRYAFLPFFYDEAGATILQAYQARIAGEEAARAERQTLFRFKWIT